jgi:transcription antitermination factor NusG
LQRVANSDSLRIRPYLNVPPTFSKHFLVNEVLQGASCECDPEGEAVSSAMQFTNQTRWLALPETSSWYALKTMSRHERVVCYELETQGVTTFLPSVTEVHRWSDRRKKVERPLFPGYLFVHGSMSPQVRRAVLFSRGVAGFITMSGEPVPIPDEQIETVHRLLANDIPCAAHPFLRIGQRVRVRGGALDGVEGILTGFNGSKGLVVSVESIQRSLAVRIEGYDVEVV